MTPSRVVIVGYGMAAARLAEQIRARDPGGRRVALTIVGAEPRPAYNRVLLSAVLAGSLATADITLHDPDWARRHRVRSFLGTPVTRLDHAARVVALADGATIGYDTLVLATGSRPWLPPVDGLVVGDGAPAEGVATLRSLDDCQRIADRAGPGVPVAVLGGGVLGVETALGLAGRGAAVTLIHPADRLMERHLDATAGAILAGGCRAAGIRTAIGLGAARHYPGEGVKLDDGAFVPAALTVVTAGVRAETGLAAGAGLPVDAGILVDDRLRTAEPRIYAIGDCAQPGQVPAGLVQPAWEQATILAELLTGGSARYHAGPVVTRLRARGVDLTAFGTVPADFDSADAEVLTFADPTRRGYAKLALAGDRVIGAIVLGLPDAAATLTQLYDDGRPAPADRVALLLGRAVPAANGHDPGRFPDSALICRCNSVTKAALVRAARNVGGDVPALVSATRAATGCGYCLGTVRSIADQLRRDLERTAG
jgi:assimilatory nitrate reductase electron transfer subunit